MGYGSQLLFELCGPSSLYFFRTRGSPDPSSPDSSGIESLLLIGSEYCFRESEIWFKGGKFTDSGLSL